MKDINPPSSLLDFADALRLIAQSQSDVTELVVKWNEIMDTTSPTTVSVLVGGLVKQVDNLAKIREVHRERSVVRQAHGVRGALSGYPGIVDRRLQHVQQSTRPRRPESL